MIALLVAMSVMAVALSVALPVFETVARREREAELVFRGRQYARAVSLFQRKYANALPPDIDVLLNEKFLRKKYKDPITGDDFQLVGPGSPELAQALNTAPQQQGRGAPQQGRGGPPVSQPAQPAGRGFQTNPMTAGQAPGGILGVISKSKQTSLRLYDGHDKYNEWIFIATQMSTAAGGRGGAQAPGGPGGLPLGGGRGRGVPPDGRGRGGQAQPPTCRGPFGQPFPQPGGPGGAGVPQPGGRRGF